MRIPGMQRNLFLAKAGHHRLATLNRKGAVFQTAAAKLYAALSHEYPELEPEDLASELEICINTGVGYHGTSPYEALFGQLPNEQLLDDTAQTVSEMYESDLPFFPQQKARAKARKAHTEAIIHERLARAQRQRPRRDMEEAFNPGDQIEFYLSSGHKGISG